MFTCGLERSNFSFDIFSSSIYIRIPNYSVTLEPAMRFELMTSSLPRRRSTPELRGPESQSAKNWSGRRDSNSRPSAWKADALPTELHPLTLNLRFQILRSQWCRGQDSNLRKALACRVYSPVPLTTRPPLLTFFKCLMEPAKGLEPPTL